MGKNEAIGKLLLGCGASGTGMVFEISILASKIRIIRKIKIENYMIKFV